MEGEEKIGAGTRVKSFLLQCKRVWLILRKPDGSEFKAVSKISALGLLVIGAIGFLVADLIKLFT
jgi:protein transport protein SEC61 subunit gamma-like protein